MKIKFTVTLIALFLASVLMAKDKAGVKLGQLSQIAASTTDMKASVEFWKKLGFRVVMQMQSPAPMTQLTDETILVNLIQSEKPFVRLSYFNSDFEGTLKALKKAKIKVEALENDESGKPWRAIIQSPDGQEVSIVNRNPAMIFHPTGKTMLTLDQADMAKPEAMPTKLGMFGEYCHKVTDLKASIAYWEKLGFQSKGAETNPYPWAIMSDGVSIVGLHQTTDWDGCALTYFAPDMGARIEPLKAQGIECKEVGMGPANVTVTSPEGVKIFLFSLF
ncbi:MAG: hypothetical protein U0176_06750 [Bacteroidia bacterium]